ncbi:peptidoglycan/xylan/chitin deacetylase (PgdA/CDA1 family) [Marmoricola sp. URHA0025 HA25]
MGLDMRVAALGAALTGLVALVAGNTSAVASTTTVASTARSTGTAAAAGVKPVVRTASLSSSRQSTPISCPAGLVALTFDDGPARGVTARLVRILQDEQVPATFFMVGSRVRTAPREARLVSRAGFAVGNHTWSHPLLTRLSDAQIRTEVRRTATILRREQIPSTTLMRPPYGDVDARVRADVHALGLVPVLWDVDSDDWRGGSSRQIASAILHQLRPHESNIVLQHDGVRNSPASIAAVPTVIRVARHRGYCFTTLGADGRMAPVDAPSEAPQAVIESPFDAVSARA